MKKVFPVFIFAVLALALGILSGYFIVNGLIPAMMQPDEETESTDPPNVYVYNEEEERLLTPSLDWLYRQYIMTVPKPDPTPTPIPAHIAAEEDFSPEAASVIDSSGFLNLPDNSTLEEVPVRKLKTKYFTVLMPGVWVDHVVVECKYIDEITESGEGADAPVYDTLLLRFYEKNNYMSYKDAKDRTLFGSGLLTELRYSSTVNDNSWLKTSNYQNYWADVRLGKTTYNVFIYEPNSRADLIREEYKERYLYLLGVNYEGCFINTFRVNGGGEVIYADDYIRKGFVDSWDPDAEGIPDGSVMPAEYE